MQKSALKIILEEAISAGAEEICLVINPGDQGPYADAAGDIATRIHFVEQAQPRGYGHALLCARSFVGNDPFLHLVSDHLYVSRAATPLRPAAGARRRSRELLGLRRPAHP